MSSKVIQYDNYTVTLELKRYKIHMKILDTLNNKTYEKSFNSEDLQIYDKLTEIYKLIEKTFNKE